MTKGKHRFLRSLLFCLGIIVATACLVGSACSQLFVSDKSYVTITDAHTNHKMNDRVLTEGDSVYFTVKYYIDPIEDKDVRQWNFMLIGEKLSPGGTYKIFLTMGHYI